MLVRQEVDGRRFTLRLVLFNLEFTMRATLLIFPLSSHNFILSPLNYNSLAQSPSPFTSPCHPSSPISPTLGRVLQKALAI